MTRKHYIALARALRDDLAPNLPPYEDMSAWERGAYDQWHTTVLAIAAVLRADNPRFDRDRFLAAAGFVAVVR